MLKSPYLFAISILVTLIHWTGVAKAQDVNMGLSFELPPVQAQALTPPVIPARPARIEIAASELAYQGKNLPPIAASLEIEENDTEENDTVENEAILFERGSAIAFSKDQLSAEALPVKTVDLDAIEQAEPEADNIALTFAANTVSIETNTTPQSTDAAALPVGEAVAFSPADHSLGLDDWIFENGTHSLVAHTVGSAEGTRQANGQRTQAYYGHTDPGNGVWNLGTFSYQHEANSPEEADKKQLQRLKRQGLELEEQATQLGMQLSLEEKLNGLDLANQAPLAALDRGGYIERLAQAKRLQMKGDEAILWARTHAYIDPNTRRWNAPGLGNNVHSISDDQDRRISAIASALRAYSPKNLNIASLAHLEQISLTNTGTNTSTGLTARAEENNEPIFGSSDVDNQILTELSEFAISFGLPPAEPSDTTSYVASATATTPIADKSNDSEHKDMPVPDIGIVFSPTGEIADPTVVASQVTDSNQNEEVEATNNETTELLTLDSLREEADTTELSATPVRAIAPDNAEAISTETTEEVSVETSTAEESTVEEGTNEITTAENNTADSSNTSDESSVQISAPSEDIAADIAAIADVDNENTANAAQLQSLLTGVNTLADPADLEALKDSERNSESALTRQFFRTEDKVVKRD
ncbi:MAG: hypothetical protein ACFB0D_02865 [Phormidesmis sp.]